MKLESKLREIFFEFHDEPFKMVEPTVRQFLEIRKAYDEAGAQEKTALLIAMCWRYQDGVNVISFSDYPKLLQLGITEFGTLSENMMKVMTVPNSQEQVSPS